MKLLSALITIIFLGIINLHASSDAVQKKYLRFIEKANDDSASESLIITDIKYSYKLFEKSPNKFDCRGTLSFSIPIPENLKLLIFGRTSPNPRDPDRIFFALKHDIPIDNTTSSDTIEDVRWNSYFRVWGHFEDGSIEYSPIYSINDFIQPADLDILMGQSSIEDLESNAIGLLVKDGNLYIETEETTDVSIFDSYGKCLFSDRTTHNIDIPLNNTQSPFIIVKCTTSTNSLTKKLIIR